MDGRWLGLAIGLFLVPVIGRDLFLAWKRQCFQKSPHQLWDVSREHKPIVFWILIVGHALMICAGIWLAVSTGIELWAA